MLSMHMDNIVITYLLTYPTFFITPPILTLLYISLQYGTDFYMLDKYPLAVRPFYTMPDPHNPVSVILHVM